MVGLLLAFTKGVNAVTQILPMNRPGLNSAYSQTVELSQLTPATSLYLTTGGTPWIYLLYFTGRTAWNIRHWPPASLAHEIQRQKSTRSIFIQSDVAHSDKAQSWIEAYKLKPVSPDLAWQQLL